MAAAVPWITAAVGLKQLFTPTPTKPKTMGYGEATGRAGDVINPMYNIQAKNTLEGLDKNLVSRGFYGQRPGDTLVMDTMGDLEAQRAAQIAGLANDMVGRSEANALSEWALMSDLLQRQQRGMLGGLDILGNAEYLPSLEKMFGSLFGKANNTLVNPDLPAITPSTPRPQAPKIDAVYPRNYPKTNSNWTNPYGGGGVGYA